MKIINVEPRPLWSDKQGNPSPHYHCGMGRPGCAPERRLLVRTISEARGWVMEIMAKWLDEHYTRELEGLLEGLERQYNPGLWASHVSAFRDYPKDKLAVSYTLCSDPGCVVDDWPAESGGSLHIVAPE